MKMDSLLEREYRLDDLMPLIQEALEAGKTVRFKPRGVSMLPMIRQGIDSVVLSPISGKLRKYDLPLYRRDDGKYILHRIIEAGNTYTCIGDNQFDYEPGVRQDQLIAVVTAFTRDKTEHKVTEAGYRLYCRLWHWLRPVRHFWRRGKGWLKRHFKKPSP